MARRSPAGALFVLSLFASLSIARADQNRMLSAPSVEAGRERHEHEVDEEGDKCEDIERRRDYWFQRRGDQGVIDRARLRERYRLDYEQYRSRLRSATDSIPGTVWASLGPTDIAGRVRSIAVHPTTAGTVYIASASGGVWKTTDSGATWTPLTEGLASITGGAVALAPSSPNTIYYGTGEPVGSASGVPGIGLLRSVDGGMAWDFPSPGLSPIPDSSWDLDVHPTNANDVLAATSSGGFRSTDGGANWSPWVVPGGTPTAATAIVRDPASASILYAAMSSFSSSKVLKSVDGGSNWTDFSTGLPSSSMSRIALAISSAGTTLYAVFEQSGAPYVYRSVSGGAWLVTPSSPSSFYFGQANYDNAISVAPGDANTVIVCGVLCRKTTNGGTNWNSLVAGGGGYHVDIHDLQYDSAGRLYMATDGGITTSLDHGDTTVDAHIGLVTAQFYDIAIDGVNATRIFGGMQDNGTARRHAPGTSWVFHTSSDGFNTAVHGRNPSVAWSSNQPIARGNFMWRTKEAGASGTPISAQVSPPFPSGETLGFATRYITDPVNPSILYYGSQRLWKSTTGGDGWFPLPTTVVGGPTWNSAKIDPIAVSKSNPAVIMVGKSADIYRSDDGGTTWEKRTTGLPVRFVNSIAIDPGDANVVYAALATTAGNAVHKSINGGLSWTASSAGLPLFAAQVVRVDPTDSSTIYCGTDVGMYRSTDGGASWSLFGTGMPKVPIEDIEIAEDGGLLRVGTHGRGAWELQIPASANPPPTASISSPASSSMTRGTTVSFSGTIGDSSGKVSGSWHFPDTWDTKLISAAGPTTVSHTFTRSGVFPITLLARDAEGAVAAATVTITVTEGGDLCSAPIVIPNAALPATSFVDTEAFPDAFDSSDPVPCAGFRYGSAWFQFTAPSTATYEFDTCGSMIDTVLSAWSGSCGALTQLACNNDGDSTGVSCPNGGSKISVSLTSGQTIRLMVHSRWFFPDRRGLVVVTAKPSGATAPTVSRIAPPAGPGTGGQSITIYGSNFGTTGTSVAIGGSMATDVTVHSTNIITATSSARGAGTVDVVVTNSDAQSGRLTGGYAYQSCTISLLPVSAAVPAAASGSSFNVTATDGCGWTAASNVPWVTTASTGIGDGVVSYTIAANTSVSSRSGSITVAGQTFTIEQSGVSATNLAASATSTTSIHLSWVSSPVDHYEVWRTSGGPFSLLASPASATYDDGSVTANTAYAYKVRPIDSTGAMGAYSNDDLAVTIFFTDDPLPTSTAIKAVHTEELRQAVNAVRTTAGLTAAGFTDHPLTGVEIRAIHLLQMRTALDEALAALSLPPLIHTAVAAGDLVKASFYQSLRNAMK